MSRNKEKRRKSLQDDSENEEYPIKNLRKYSSASKNAIVGNKKKKVFEKIEESINSGYRTG
jgi:hypothetical protein